MLTEVAERALSLTGADELVLGGGVGQNARLQRMLGEMCEQRGPNSTLRNRFLRDNAGMIAALGARMSPRATRSRSKTRPSTRTSGPTRST